MIEPQPVLPGLFVSRAHVNATSLPKLDPPSLGEFAIRGADSVGVDVVTTRELTRARQTLGYFQVVTDDTENYLRHQLLADGNFTVSRDPDAHGRFDRISRPA